MLLVSEPAVVTAVAAAGARDLLVTFLTLNEGGVRLFAKRQARRPSPTRFLEPLQGGELVFTRSREGSFGKLQSFVPQRVWPGIRGSFERTFQAIAFLEPVNLCITEGEPQPELFTLLVRCLNRIEGERRPGLARIVATLRLLAVSGFAPQLETCVGCRSGVGAGTGVLLSPEAGGVICRSCLGARREQTLAVTPGAHGFMVRALSLPDGQVRRLSVRHAIEREVSRLLDSFIEARTGVRPRCGAYLESLEVA